MRGSCKEVFGESCSVSPKSAFGGMCFPPHFKLSKRSFNRNIQRVGYISPAFMRVRAIGKMKLEEGGGTERQKQRQREYENYTWAIPSLNFMMRQ